MRATTGVSLLADDDFDGSKLIQPSGSAKPSAFVVPDPSGLED
jgi:hypothetical protein